MAYNLFIARQMTQAFLRSNGFDSTLYTASVLDTGFSAAGEELARRTTCLERTDSITLTSGSNAIPVVSLPVGFRPARLRAAYLYGSNVNANFFPSGFLPGYTEGGPIYPIGICQGPTLNLRSYMQVNAENIAYPNQSGQPFDIAFQKRDGTGIVFPTPDDNYTCNLLWNDLFANWQLGTQGAWSSTQQYYVGDVVSSAGTIYQCIANTLNNTPPNTTYWLSLGTGTLTAPTAVTFTLPDDILQPLFMYGAPSKLQFNEPGNTYAASAAAKWEEFIKSIEDAEDLGDQQIQRATGARDYWYGDLYW